MMVKEEVQMQDRPQVVGAPSGLTDADVGGYSSSGAAAAAGGGLRMRGRDVSEQVADDDEDEDAGFVRQDVPTPQERKWSLWVAVVSGVDVVFSTVIIATSFSFAYRDAGVSLWCMGIQSISHLLSSVMLMLRFAGERGAGLNTDEASAARLMRRARRRFLLREQGVMITMGLVMLLSSAGLMFKAFTKIKFWKVWYKDHEKLDAQVQFVLEFLAWYGFSAYLLQAIFRFVAARKLRRWIFWHAFSASVVSLIFLLFMGMAASYQKEWSWKAEPICAIILASVALAEGIRIVIMHLDDVDARLRYDPRA